MNNFITVEVAYATRDRQVIIEMEIEEGCTIEAAIHRSGILSAFPTIDLAKQTVGIFSKPQSLTTIVTSGDRIEIYRPLQQDPKETRRNKAKQQAKKNLNRG